MNRRLRKVFNALVRVYPRDFREQYGEAMAEHFENERSDGADMRNTIVDVFGTSLRMRFENLSRDLVYAIRMNLRAPLFSIVVVGAIALAIAVNTVAFALLDAVLLKPLPFSNPSQIGFVWSREPSSLDRSISPLSSEQVGILAKASTVFSSAAASMEQDVADPDGLRMLKDQLVTPNYFHTLGVRPEIGRFLSGKKNEAVISDKMWRERFGASASVLGRPLLLSGTSYTIVGVAPPGMLDPFAGSLVSSDFWTAMPTHDPDPDTLYDVFPIVRLRAGIGWQAAQADLDRISPALSSVLFARATRGSAELPGVTYHTGPISDSVLGPAQTYLWIVFAAVTGVLLIACANVANLLLARGAAREGEFAIRRSLGASPKRVASQVFVETLLLAVGGAVLGVAAARFLLPWAASALPQSFPRLHDAAINTPVLLYVCAMTIAVAFLAGMLPAYRTAMTRDRGSAARLRAALAIAEIAIAFALVTGSGLLLRSFVEISSVPVGFNAQNVYTATVMPKNGFFTVHPRAARPQTALRLVSRLRALPGVRDAAVATSVPFQNAFIMRMLFNKPGTPPGDYADSFSADGSQVTQSYFRLMGIPLLRGREFEAQDYLPQAQAIVVNEAFARKYFAGRNPIGEVLNGRNRIVGVVGDTRTTHEQPPQPMVYEPFNGLFGPFFTALLRTGRRIPALHAEVTRVMRESDPEGGPVTFDSLDHLVAQDESGIRTSLALLGGLAAAALLLALVGIYSIVAYGVERRFREIGIRMALGAEPGRVLASVIRGALLQASAGIALGLIVSALTTKYLASQLFETSPLDPPTLIGVAALLAFCTALAALVPGIRAAITAPAAILRYE
jgi:putative ABC transport system permease protein